MTWLHIALLAIIQGFAELLPVSSSAHVILAERLMGLDPGAPEMTYLLVMLHTGTMFAVLIYFWRRWLPLIRSIHFPKMIILATAATGAVGLGLKKFIEKVVLHASPHAEIEHLFRNLPLMAASLFTVGWVIVIAGSRQSPDVEAPLTPKRSLVIGIVQGLCLPFRGFSRSGATISTALFYGISQEVAEQFSFSLAVVLTPAVLFLEVHRLLKAKGALLANGQTVTGLLSHGFLGMFFSALAGLVALRWLSSWLEQGKWKYFGYYCWFASAMVLLAAILLPALP